MIHKRQFLKLIAAVVFYAFFAEQVVLAASPQIAWVRGGAHKRTLQHSQDLGISIPKRLGLSQDAHLGKSPQTVIQIQDAHDSLIAQERIADILGTLVTQYDLRMIALEGSSGEIDTSMIRSFPDEDFRDDFAHAMLARGTLNAGEFFSILSKEPVRVFGVEDRKLYDRDLDAFRKLHKRRKSLRISMQRLRDLDHTLKEAIYPEDLLELLENGVLMSAEHVGFTEKWSKITELARSKEISLKPYPNLSKLTSVTQLEREIDFKRVNLEREALLKELNQTLDQNALQTLVLKTLEFKSGKSSEASFYFYLNDLALKQGISAENYAGLANYSQYLVQFEGLDLPNLFEEAERFESEVVNALVTTGQEAEFLEVSERVRLLIHLVDGSLAAKDYQIYRNSQADFTIDYFQEALSRFAEEFEVEFAHATDLGVLFEAQPDALNFYKLAKARDQALVNGTLKRMRSEGVEVAALVSGGFHTEGISELLRHEDMSYLVVAPRLAEKDSKRPYIALLTKRPSLELDSLKSEFEIVLGTIFDSSLKHPDEIELAMTQLLSEYVLSGRVDSLASFERTKAAWLDRFVREGRGLSLTPRGFRAILDNLGHAQFAEALEGGVHSLNLQLTNGQSYRFALDESPRTVQHTETRFADRALKFSDRAELTQAVHSARERFMGRLRAEAPTSFDRWRAQWKAQLRRVGITSGADPVIGQVTAQIAQFVREETAQLAAVGARIPEEYLARMRKKFANDLLDEFLAPEHHAKTRLYFKRGETGKWINRDLLSEEDEDKGGIVSTVHRIASAERRLMEPGIELLARIQTRITEEVLEGVKARVRTQLTPQKQWHITNKILRRPKEFLSDARTFQPVDQAWSGALIESLEFISETPQHELALLGFLVTKEGALLALFYDVDEHFEKLRQQIHAAGEKLSTDVVPIDIVHATLGFFVDVRYSEDASERQAQEVAVRRIVREEMQAEQARWGTYEGSVTVHNIDLIRFTGWGSKNWTNIRNYHLVKGSRGEPGETRPVGARQELIALKQAVAAEKVQELVAQALRSAQRISKSALEEIATALGAEIKEIVRVTPNETFSEDVIKYAPDQPLLAVTYEQKTRQVHNLTAMRHQINGAPVVSVVNHSDSPNPIDGHLDLDDHIAQSVADLDPIHYIVGDDEHYYLFEDLVTGVTYMRRGDWLSKRGLYVKLEPGQSHSFTVTRLGSDDQRSPQWIDPKVLKWHSDRIKGDGHPHQYFQPKNLIDMYQKATTLKRRLRIYPAGLKIDGGQVIYFRDYSSHEGDLPEEADGVRVIDISGDSALRVRAALETIRFEAPDYEALKAIAGRDRDTVNFITQLQEMRRTNGNADFLANAVIEPMQTDLEDGVLALRIRHNTHDPLSTAYYLIINASSDKGERKTTHKVFHMLFPEGGVDPASVYRFTEYMPEVRRTSVMQSLQYYDRPGNVLVEQGLKIVLDNYQSLGRSMHLFKAQQQDQRVERAAVYVHAAHTAADSNFSLRGGGVANEAVWGQDLMVGGNVYLTSPLSVLEANKQIRAQVVVNTGTDAEQVFPAKIVEGRSKAQTGRYYFEGPVQFENPGEHWVTMRFDVVGDVENQQVYERKEWVRVIVQTPDTQRFFPDSAERQQSAQEIVDAMFPALRGELNEGSFRKTLRDKLHTCVAAYLSNVMQNGALLATTYVPTAAEVNDPVEVLGNQTYGYNWPRDAEQAASAGLAWWGHTGHSALETILQQHLTYSLRGLNQLTIAPGHDMPGLAQGLRFLAQRWDHTGTKEPHSSWSSPQTDGAAHFTKFFVELMQSDLADLRSTHSVLGAMVRDRLLDHRRLSPSEFHDVDAIYLDKDRNIHTIVDPEDKATQAAMVVALTGMVPYLVRQAERVARIAETRRRDPLAEGDDQWEEQRGMHAANYMMDYNALRLLERFVEQALAEDRGPSTLDTDVRRKLGEIRDLLHHPLSAAAGKTASEAIKDGISVFMTEDYPWIRSQHPDLIETYTRLMQQKEQTLDVAVLGVAVASEFFPFPDGLFNEQLLATYNGLDHFFQNEQSSHPFWYGPTLETPDLTYEQKYPLVRLWHRYPGDQYNNTDKAAHPPGGNPWHLNLSWAALFNFRSMERIMREGEFRIETDEHLLYLKNQGLVVTRPGLTFHVGTVVKKGTPEFNAILNALYQRASQTIAFQREIAGVGEPFAEAIDKTTGQPRGAEALQWSNWLWIDSVHKLFGILEQLQEMGVIAVHHPETWIRASQTGRALDEFLRHAALDSEDGSGVSGSRKDVTDTLRRQLLQFDYTVAFPTVAEHIREWSVLIRTGNIRIVATPAVVDTEDDAAFAHFNGKQLTLASELVLKHLPGNTGDDLAQEVNPLHLDTKLVQELAYRAFLEWKARTDENFSEERIPDNLAMAFGESYYLQDGKSHSVLDAKLAVLRTKRLWARHNPGVSREVIYELNTMLALNEIWVERCRQHGVQLFSDEADQDFTPAALRLRPTLADEEVHQRILQISDLGASTLWFMGVNERSRIASMVAKAWFEGHGQNPQVYGASAYSVAGYGTDERLGGAAGWAAVRERLKAPGLKLKAGRDLVANHTGFDFPWVTTHPEMYIWLTPEVEARLKSDNNWNPGDWFKYTPQNTTVAELHGQSILKSRETWDAIMGTQDVAQLSLHNVQNWERMIEILEQAAAETYDKKLGGVLRVDLAHYLLRDNIRRLQKYWTPEQLATFEAAYGGLEFWEVAIPRLKAKYPKLTLLAESYGGFATQMQLLALGFDIAYNKEGGSPAGFWDIVVGRAHVQEMNQHFRRIQLYDRNGFHFSTFIANHDESMVRDLTNPQQHRAAVFALHLARSVGATPLIYDGEERGMSHPATDATYSEHQFPPERHFRDEAHAHQHDESTRGEIYEDRLWQNPAFHKDTQGQALVVHDGKSGKNAGDIGAVLLRDQDRVMLGVVSKSQRDAAGHINLFETNLFGKFGDQTLFLMVDHASEFSTGQVTSEGDDEKTTYLRTADQLQDLLVVLSGNAQHDPFQLLEFRRIEATGTELDRLRNKQAELDGRGVPLKELKPLLGARGAQRQLMREIRARLQITKLYLQGLRESLRLQFQSRERRRLEASDTFLRYLSVMENLETSYHLYGSQLFGADRQRDVTALLLAIGEAESGYLLQAQAGGPALSSFMLEPETIKTIIVRSLRDETSTFRTVLLQGLDADETEALKQLFHGIRKERGSGVRNPNLKVHITQLMQRTSFVHKMIYLYLGTEAKRLRLEIPNYQDRAEKVDFYLRVWRPGQFVPQRVAFDFWLVEALSPLIGGDLKQVDDEAVARFGERFQFHQALSRIYVLVQMVKNILRKSEQSILARTQASGLFLAAERRIESLERRVRDPGYPAHFRQDVPALLEGARMALRTHTAITHAPAAREASVIALNAEVGSRVAGSLPPLTAGFRNSILFLRNTIQVTKVLVVGMPSLRTLVGLWERDPASILLAFDMAQSTYGATPARIRDVRSGSRLQDMGKIVQELKERGWNNTVVSKLGEMIMEIPTDQEEVVQGYLDAVLDENGDLGWTVFYIDHQKDVSHQFFPARFLDGLHRDRTMTLMLLRLARHLLDGPHERESLSAIQDMLKDTHLDHEYNSLLVNDDEPVMNFARHVMTLLDVEHGAPNATIPPQYEGRVELWSDLRNHFATAGDEIHRVIKDIDAALEVLGPDDAGSRVVIGIPSDKPVLMQETQDLVTSLGLRNVTLRPLVSNTPATMARELEQLMQGFGGGQGMILEDSLEGEGQKLAWLELIHRLSERQVTLNPLFSRVLQNDLTLDEMTPETLRTLMEAIVPLLPEAANRTQWLSAAESPAWIQGLIQARGSERFATLHAKLARERATLYIEGGENIGDVELLAQMELEHIADRQASLGPLGVTAAIVELRATHAKEAEHLRLHLAHPDFARNEFAQGQAPPLDSPKAVIWTARTLDPYFLEKLRNRDEQLSEGQRLSPMTDYLVVTAEELNGLRQKWGLDSFELEGFFGERLVLVEEAGLSLAQLMQVLDQHFSLSEFYAPQDLIFVDGVESPFLRVDEDSEYLLLLIEPNSIHVNQTIVRILGVGGDLATLNIPGLEFLSGSNILKYIPVVPADFEYRFRLEKQQQTTTQTSV